MSKEPKDNFISRAVAGYKKTVPNPMVQALLAGGLVYGAGKLAWSPIVNTISALARHPAKAMGGMSDQDWDMAMWELKNKPMYKTWMPVAIGALAAGTSLVATSSGNRKNYGMLDWNAPTNLQGIFKAASDDLMYGGYVPEIDMSECISGIDAVSMFTNDPYLSNDPYVRNMGTAIVTDAANSAGSINPSLGNIFDSAVNKIEKKLTFAGLVDTGVKTVIANAAANLFTNALGTMVTIPQATKNNLVSAGTWAGAVSAILN